MPGLVPYCLCGMFPLKIDFIAAGGKLHSTTSCVPTPLIEATAAKLGAPSASEWGAVLNLLQSIDNKLARVLSALEAPRFLPPIVQDDPIDTMLSSLKPPQR